MKTVYLPEKELLPNVRMARLYDTETDRKKVARVPRVSDCYELSCYISAGGILTVEDMAREVEKVLCPSKSAT